MKKCSIVIPSYNVQDNIPLTFQVIKKDVLKAYDKVEFEVIFVDDGSYDRTFSVLEELIQVEPNVKAVKLSRNFGEFYAVLAGMSVASGDCIAVIGCDLQDPPHLICPMIDSWLTGNKVTIAARSSRIEDKWKTFLAESYYKLYRWIVNKDYPKHGFDFFVIDKSVKDILLSMDEKNSSVYIQLIWTGFQPKIIEYVRQDREVGTSMWTYGKRINLFIDAFITFSNKPIRFVSLIGYVTSFIFGLLLLVSVIGNWLSPYYGNPFMMLVYLIVFLFGILMSSIGLVGEYVYRAMENARNRPSFIIDKIIEKEQ